MARITDLWKKHDELIQRKEKGEDVQEEIDRVLKEMQKERDAQDGGASAEEAALREAIQELTRQPGQFLPQKPPHR